MGTEALEKAYSDYLNTLNIHVLRNVARCVGVYKPTDGKKDNVIARTILVLTGAVEPVPPSTRGAPLKEDTLDPKYMRELERIRQNYALTGQNEEYRNVLQVRSGDTAPNDYDRPLYMGILELSEGGDGYLRGENGRATAGKDVFVSSRNIRDWNLREGDYVVGYVAVQAENELFSLSKVLSVNAVMPDKKRRVFEELPLCYPEEKINFSENNAKLSLRYLDLFTPVGKGQRALVCAQPFTEADALLRDIALAVEDKRGMGENLRLLTLLIDERPEDVTEFRRIVRPEEMYYTTFDVDEREHLRLAKLIFARAKRLAEEGEDVVVLLNSLNRLTRAADACCSGGKTLPCGLDVSAFKFPRTCLSVAGKLSGGGSVTVIAAVSTDTGDEADEVIRNEFEKICNCRITLSCEIAEKQIFPAVDIRNSYTDRAEKLLSAEEAECARVLRTKYDGEQLYEVMQRFADNDALVRQTLNDLNNR